MNNEKQFNNDVCVSAPTWGELLRFIQDKIDPKFYDKPVSILIDDASYSKRLTSVEVLQESIYQHKEDADVYGSDDRLGTLEDLKLAHADHDGAFKEEDYILKTEKGHPFLYLDEEDAQ